MSLEAAIITKLGQTGTVTSLVSDRIYRMILPQTPTLPAISIQRISTPREHSHEGPSGLAYPRVQFNCYGTKQSVAQAVADAVRAALDGFRGTVGSETISNAMTVGQHDDYDPVLDRYRTILDIKFHHGE